MIPLELKIPDADIKAFENELRRFARGYKEVGVIRVDVGEWEGIDEIDQGLDIVPIEQSEGRGWRVNIIRQSAIKPWLQIPNLGMDMWAARIGPGILRLKIYLLQNSARVFVKKFEAHCVKTWNAVRMGGQPAPNEGNGGKGQLADSGHYTYPPEKRWEIVQAYKEAKAKGEVENQDTWAGNNYQISGKTLRNYIKEVGAET
jgi:hypothetical protein